MTETREPAVIHNGDHLEYELENSDIRPEDRSDWPLPSFDSSDWAKAFVKLNPACDEGAMISWFSSALMRGYDEGRRAEKKAWEEALKRAQADPKPKKAPEWLGHIKPVTEPTLGRLRGDGLVGVRPLVKQTAWEAFREGFREAISTIFMLIGILLLVIFVLGVLVMVGAVLRAAWSAIL